MTINDNAKSMRIIFFTKIESSPIVDWAHYFNVLCWIHSACQSVSHNALLWSFQAQLVNKNSQISTEYFWENQSKVALREC